MSADILPAVCPDTPKYLEAQYQCISHSQKEERSSQYKLPELGGNISDVWSERDIVLDREAVEDAIKTVIRKAHIPVTERPETVSVYSDNIENVFYYFQKHIPAIQMRLMRKWDIYRKKCPSRLHQKKL